MRNTVFDYAVSGNVDEVVENRAHCMLVLDDDLNKTLKQFWEIESVDVKCRKNTKASLFKEHFVRNRIIVVDT
ncbi:DUF1758 domain-containing protein [Trichonephila clavipes]|nr:DUF1758 domain-containing protein [Trichonephila clavipes]